MRGATFRVSNQFHLIDSSAIVLKKASNLPSTPVFSSIIFPPSFSPPPQPVTPSAHPLFYSPSHLAFHRELWCSISGRAFLLPFPPQRSLFHPQYTCHREYFLIQLIKVKLVNQEHQLAFNEIRGGRFGAITWLPSPRLLFWPPPQVFGAVMVIEWNLTWDLFIYSVLQEKKCKDLWNKWAQLINCKP